MEGTESFEDDGWSDRLHQDPCPLPRPRACKGKTLDEHQGPKRQEWRKADQHICVQEVRNQDTEPKVSTLFPQHRAQCPGQSGARMGKTVWLKRSGARQTPASAKVPLGCLFCSDEWGASLKEEVGSRHPSSFCSRYRGWQWPRRIP